MWRESRSDNRPVDLLISPDFQTELKLRLADAQIPYEVKIADMQTEINNENPNITDSGTEFENRFSKILKSFGKNKTKTKTKHSLCCISSN